jgi:hypothetical protein
MHKTLSLSSWVHLRQTTGWRYLVICACRKLRINSMRKILQYRANHLASDFSAILTRQCEDRLGTGLPSVDGLRLSASG